MARLNRLFARVSLVCLLAWVGVSLPAAAAEPAAVAFVVSAGRTMGEPFGDTTRFDAGRDGLVDVLEDLATMRTASVGIWLYGHRLAWQSGDAPMIDDNADYLAQSRGFAAISGLLPGDDIEQVRAVSEFDGAGLAMLRPLLDVVKPFGEAPLPAAVRGAEAAVGAGMSLRKGIILITDGAVSARMARRSASFEDALSACDRHGVPVHVVLIGDGASPVERHALEELARLSEGSLQSCESPLAVRRAIPVALLRVLGNDRENTPSAPVVDGRSRPRGGITAVKLSDAPPQPEAAGSAPRLPVPNTTTRITGVVLHGTKPVPRAKVAIEGAEPDRVTTDRDGRFVFEKVPEGLHELVVEGIARNKIREVRKRLVLASPLPSKRTVEVQLP